VLLIGINTTTKAQSDADKYWILEDFSQFESIADTLWVMGSASYDLYPNQVKLNTYYANFEEPSGCSKGRASLRIRGLKDNGYAEFTIPDASTVTFSITGKRIEKDRSVRIQRNGVVVFTQSDFDRNDCISFTDSVYSQTPLTYKITTDEPLNNDPIALLGIEAVKYGVNIEPEPQPELSRYWIYDDLDSHDIEEDYNIGAKTYYSLPNSIELITQNANIEYGQDCTQGSRNLLFTIY
ncbi:hypothetical protein LJB91_01180, partial [Bacteroidales bacterium OttesenSCG-928-L03]|nr:hypothetical protein [Bacteroidales bacterium OttesenSCG-928-L03]